MEPTTSILTAKIMSLAAPMAWAVVHMCMYILYLCLYAVW